MMLLRRIADKVVSTPVYISLGLYICLHISDTLLTYMGLSLGAREIGLAYRVVGDMTVSVSLKWFVAILTPLILWRFNQLNWLIWFVMLASIAVFWNIKELLLYCLS